MDTESSADIPPWSSQRALLQTGSLSSTFEAAQQHQPCRMCVLEPQGIPALHREKMAQPRAPMLPCAEAWDKLLICSTTFSASPTSITQLITNRTKQNEEERYLPWETPPAEDISEHNSGAQMLPLDGCLNLVLPALAQDEFCPKRQQHRQAHQSIRG